LPKGIWVRNLIYPGRLDSNTIPGEDNCNTKGSFKIFRTANSDVTNNLIGDIDFMTHPNPFNNQLRITFTQIYPLIELNLFDVKGDRVCCSQLKNSTD